MCRSIKEYVEEQVYEEVEQQHAFYSQYLFITCINMMGSYKGRYLVFVYHTLQLDYLINMMVGDA